MLSSLSTSDQPGILKCTRAWCKTCPFICNVEIISGPKRSIKITVNFTCTSTNVIYCITCTLCKKLYIGETERQIGDDSEKTLVMLKETAKTHVNRELRSFCPRSVSPQVVLPQLKVISPQLKVISLPRPKVGLPEFFSYDLESKWLIWTKQALLRPYMYLLYGIKAMFSNTIGHRSINRLCLTLLLFECNNTSDLCA